MFEHILTTIQLGCILLYSYIFNYLLLNDKVKHQLFCIHKMTKINMLFIKFMQWFSSNNMSDEVKDVIRKFADNVPYNDNDIDYELFNNIIKKAESLNYDIKINITPINSGTIALVFEGHLNNNPIIIKTLRKNIENKLIDSIELMKFIGIITSYIPYMKLFNFKELIDINQYSIIEQLDFKKEIENLKLFKEAFNDKELIVIPDVYEELTVDFNNIIIMERIKGRKVQELDDNELENYCETYNNLLIDSLITKRILHADLHLGNIFFLENNKIALVDFGYIIHISKETSKTITHFYKFMFNRQVKKMTTLCLEKAVSYNKIHDKNNKQFIIKKNKAKEGIQLAFSNENILSGKKPMDIYNIIELNTLMKDIDACMETSFMNVILSIGPMSSVVSILKRNDTDNSLKYVFNKYVFNKIPDTLKNY